MNIYWLLIIFTSFVTLEGMLNENFYIKLFAFELFFLFACLYSLVKMKNNPFPYIALTWADIMVLLFGGIYLSHCVGSYNIIDHSLPIIYVLFYFFVRFNRESYCINALIALVPLIVFVHLILCFLQYISLIPNYNSYFRVGSTFGNPDMLSAYLSVLLSFCYGGNKWKKLRVFLILLTVTVFFLLQARTAIVAFVITLFAYCIYRRLLSKRMIALIALGVIFGIILLVWWHSKSVYGRIYIWIVSLGMILDKPLGWGLYSFEKEYPEFQAQYTIAHPDLADTLNYDVVHSPYNEFLNMGVSFGIIAMLLYLTFVCFILFSAYKQKSFLFFPLLTYQVVSVSYFPFRIVPLAILYIACSAIVVSDSVYSFRLTFPIRWRRIIILCICGIVSSCLGLSSYCYKNWQKAVRQSAFPVTYENACHSFGKCYPFLKHNGRFLISYAELRYKLGERQAAYDLMHQAECYFSDMAFLYHLAMIYEEEGDTVRAKDKLNLASNMSPDNLQILIAQIRFLQRIGDDIEAERLKNAYFTKSKTNSVQ